jgi:CRISPR/Cas system CSM-associated protein Csm3 (group 7 of RAMP superfamily)
MSRPYDFVPFLPYKAVSNNRRVYNKEKIELTIKVLTPVHIGSGKIQAEKDYVFKMFLKNNDEYIIPGTSVKGAIRSIAESISYSCFNASRDKDYVDSKYDNNQKNEVTRKLPSNKRCNINNLCIICDMFGAMGRKSRVKFSDFTLMDGDTEVIKMPALKNPHPLREWYSKDGKFIGSKFFYHGVPNILEKGNVPHQCVSKGAIFKGNLIVKDLTEEEMQLLCFSLGLSGDIQPKLGYGKPAYFGSIEISTDNTKYIELAKAYKNNEDNGIKSRVDKLISILNWKNAKKVSDWENFKGARTY